MVGCRPFSSRCLHVSFPSPVLPPVTKKVLPVKSGMSVGVHFALGGNIWSRRVNNIVLQRGRIGGERLRRKAAFAGVGKSYSPLPGLLIGGEIVTGRSP